jgi:hypothetical protein
VKRVKGGKKMQYTIQGKTGKERDIVRRKTE